MRAGRLALIAAGIAGAAFAVIAIERVPIMVGAGSFLDVGAAPVKADLIVVLRGDETYFERALTAADLFRRGFAPYVYVSSALSDLAEAALAARGIRVSSPQQTMASVLMQSGIPCGRILLDRSPPGGGTVGELKRVRATLQARGLHSALVVTSWFHARRARLIAHRVIEQQGLSAVILVANGETGPQNWWHYRYLAITVLEEYAKYLIQLFPGQLSFVDDPEPTNRPKPQLQPPAPCAAVESRAAVAPDAR
jgi:uncharacterized SAM-binding protein YcdF (DUF218 family)